MSDTSVAKKRTRTRTSHSKGGCITCKVRHLKCDQAKPTCLRCAKAGWQCDGYAVPKPPTKPSRQIRALAPKNLLIQPILPLSEPAPRQHFNDERDFQCFESFRFKVATQLASFVNVELWRYIVSQTAEPNSPVIRAALAFGAWSLPETLEYNREYAFAEYGKALSLIRHALSSTSENEVPTRQVVVTLLLCVNFEVLAGCEKSATQLTIIGINFLQINVLAKMPLREIISSRSSPIPSDVENDMIEAFAPLDTTVAPLNDAHSTALHDLYRQCCQHTIEPVSGSAKLKEAYLCLGFLVRRALHHLAYLEPFLSETTSFEESSISTAANQALVSDCQTLVHC